MKKKIIAIIQARLTSKRFPNKVIQKIGNLTIIELILKRLKKSKLTDEIIFAIPSNKKNSKLFTHINEIGGQVFRGSENNVLDRYFKIAKQFKASDIIRVTADCPLTDPKIIDKMIQVYLRDRPDYLNNAFPPNYSDGFDVEIFSFNALKLAKIEAVTNFDREHVTPYIRRSNKIKKQHIEIIKNYNIKLSVDKKEDLKKVKKVYSYFHPNIFFSVKDIFKKNLHKKFFAKEIKKENFLQNRTIAGQKFWKSIR